MSFVRRSGRLIFAAVLCASAVGSQIAAAAIGDRGHERIAAADGTAIPDNIADVELLYIQEDGPESGHVRVVLTPQTRPLTRLEVRSAAQQAFLAALDEPGLGASLSRITVVVKLAPASHPDGAEQVILFQHKGGREWAVLSGE